MITTVNRSPAIICAENISFLYLLHEVPESPNHNRLETEKPHPQGYVLSLKQERQLVESLAFLANDSEDLNHIPALCVQQNEMSSLNVLLAINRVAWQDGEQSLLRLRHGFENIFRSLTRSERPLDTESETFSAIVAMCKERIVLRLRLTQGKRGQKQNIQSLLQITVDYFKRRSGNISGHQGQGSASFIEKGKLVSRKADEWLNHQTPPRLEEMVESVYQLKRAVDVEKLLRIIPNQYMDPSSRASLTNIIQKISRYREIARSLSRMSKKHSILRDMNMVAVSLPEEAHVRVPMNYAAPRLATILARAGQPCRPAEVARVCRLINVGPNQCQEQFAGRLAETLSRSKIHAEIQLLYHVELHTSSLPPRVIASSKDACFLCNAFIIMHGKMHVARTHGRLWPGWRLPSLPAFASLDQRFNEVLARKIAASVTTLRARGHKTVYPYPNESTLLMLPHSASTLRSLTMTQDHTIEQNIAMPPLNHNTVSELLVDNAAITSRDGTEGRSTTRSQEIRKQADEEPEQHSTETSASIGQGEGHESSEEQSIDTVPTLTAAKGLSKAASPSLSDSVMEVDMIQGRAIALIRNTKILLDGKLRLHIECPTASHGGNAAYFLVWLNDEEMDSIAATRGLTIADVEHLTNETKYEVDDQGRLFLTARGVTVSLTIRRP